MINFKVQLNQNAINQLLKIPDHVKYAVIDKALPAMAKPIMEKASMIVPRSTNPGKDGIPTRDKWGKNKTKGFDPNTWRRDVSGDHIGYKIKKTTEGAFIKVGARSPRGNKQRFNQFKYTARKVFHWGFAQGTTYSPPYRFMQRSYDETISQQHSSFNAALTTAIQGMNFG